MSHQAVNQNITTPQQQGPPAKGDPAAAGPMQLGLAPDLTDQMIDSLLKCLPPAPEPDDQLAESCCAAVTTFWRTNTEVRLARIASIRKHLKTLDAHVGVIQVRVEERHKRIRIVRERYKKVIQIIDCPERWYGRTLALEAYQAVRQDVEVMLAEWRPLAEEAEHYACRSGGDEPVLEWEDQVLETRLVELKSAIEAPPYAAEREIIQPYFAGLEQQLQGHKVRGEAEDLRRTEMDLIRQNCAAASKMLTDPPRWATREIALQSYNELLRVSSEIARGWDVLRERPGKSEPLGPCWDASFEQRLVALRTAIEAGPCHFQVARVREVLVAFEHQVQVVEIHQASRVTKTQQIVIDRTSAGRLLCDHGLWTDERVAAKTLDSLRCATKQMVTIFRSVREESVTSVSVQDTKTGGVSSGGGSITTTSTASAATAVATASSSTSVASAASWDTTLDQYLSDLQQDIHGEPYRVPALRVIWLAGLAEETYEALTTYAKSIPAPTNPACWPIPHVIERGDEVARGLKSVRYHALGIASACEAADAEKQARCLDESLGQLEDATQHYACVVRRLQFSARREERILYERYTAASSAIGLYTTAIYAARADVRLVLLTVAQKVVSYYQTLVTVVAGIEAAFASTVMDHCGRRVSCIDVIRCLRTTVERGLRHAELIGCEVTCEIIETQYAHVEAVHRESLAAYATAQELGIDLCPFNDLWPPQTSIRKALTDASRLPTYPVTEGFVHQVQQFMKGIEQASADPCATGAPTRMMRTRGSGRRGQGRIQSTSAAPASAAGGSTGMPAGAISNALSTAAQAEQVWQSALDLAERLAKVLPRNLQSQAKALVTAAKRERDYVSRMAESGAAFDGARAARQMRQFLLLAQTLKHVAGKSIPDADYAALGDAMLVLGGQSGQPTTAASDPAASAPPPAGSADPAKSSAHGCSCSSATQSASPYKRLVSAR